MREVTADANIVIAYIESQHVHHTMAVELLDQFDRIWVHPINMAEVLVGLLSPTERSRKLQDLTGAGFVIDLDRTTEELHNEVLDLANLRAEYRAKMPDTCALLTAHRKRTTLATLDAGLRKAALAAGIETIP